MKKLNIISGILNFFKWAFVVIGVVALVVMAVLKDEPIMVGSPLISIADEQLQNTLDEIINTGGDVRLVADGFAAEVSMTWQLRVLKCTAIVAVFAYLLWILQIIINIVKDVKNSNAFRSVNIARLKHIAWLLILSPLFVALMNLVFLVVIGSTYDLPEGFTYSWYEDIDFDFLVIGFLLYAISIAFGEGLKMKQEQELTI